MPRRPDPKAFKRGTKLCAELVKEQLVDLAEAMAPKIFTEPYGAHVSSDFRTADGFEVTIYASLRVRAPSEPPPPAPKKEPRKLGSAPRLLLEGPKP